jgi:hypothetical protein
LIGMRERDPISDITEKERTDRLTSAEMLSLFSCVTKVCSHRPEISLCADEIKSVPIFTVIRALRGRRRIIVNIR